METVKNLSGIAEEDIEELFNETDANDDGIVMRSEVLASLKKRMNDLSRTGGGT